MFPTDLVDLPNPDPRAPTNSPVTPLAGGIANLNAVVEALQAKVGVDGSTVPTSLEKRLTDAAAVAAAAAADVITAQQTADAAIVDTQQAEWGERTDATTGRPLVPLIETARDTCYFWTWPASNATARYGEHHIYVPIGSGTDYYGVILGVRAKSAYSVPFDCVHGIFRPGLHTRASACTRVGSWSSNSNVGALWGDYYYSVAAGATISASVTGSVVAVQHYLASNGGYAVVSVDGSYTFNSPLPVFSSQDYANGLCRAADVGRHYLSCYAAAGWSLSQVIAEDGPEHDKTFRAVVLVDEEPLGIGHGRSKKQAEQAAAQEAWLALDRRRGDAPAREESDG